MDNDIQQQGSPEWVRARIGYITASRFGDLMSKGQSGATLSRTAEKYLFGKIGEHFTGLPADDWSTPAVRWGLKYEPFARAEYEVWTNTKLYRDYLIRHPTLQWVSCSPDGGLMDDPDGLVEIKCPFRTENHIRTVVTREVPPEYLAQVQGNMWVADRKWCDYVSYDPRVKAKRLDPESTPGKASLVILRVDRDEDYINKLAMVVEKFQKIMLTQLEKIENEPTPF